MYITIIWIKLSFYQIIHLSIYNRLLRHDKLLRQRLVHISLDLIPFHQLKFGFVDSAKQEDNKTTFSGSQKAGATN